VFLGETIGPFDQIRQMAPWNGPKPAQPWDVLQADGVLQFYAWRDLVFTGWGQGVAPTWNPYQLGGTPLMANSQSGAYYLPHILLGVAHVPTGLAIVLLAWFHLALAGTGTYALVRQLGGTRIGGAVAGVLFGLSPFMLAWAALPSVISTVAWIPWLFASIAAQFRTHNRTRGTLWSLGIPFSILAAFAAGHLQFAAYGLIGAALFGITLLVTRSKEKEVSKPAATVRTLALVLVGFAFAAIVLLPVLSYSQFSHRRNVPNATGYQDYLLSALRPADVVSRLANPYGQGNPGAFVTADAPFSTFWPVISRRAPYAESALTIGPIALMLLGLLLVLRPKGRRYAPLLVVGGFALLIALGSPLNQLLYFYAPGWSSTGSLGRVICLLVLALCALAGLAIPDEATDKKKAGLGVGIGALLSLLSLLPLADAAPKGFSADVWSAISGAAAGEGPKFLLAVLIAGAGAWLAFTRREKAGPVLLGATVLSGLVLHVPTLVRTGDAAFLHTKPLAVDANARVAIINANWDMWQAAPALYPPNTASVARIHELGGYDSLLHRDTVAMLNEVSSGDPAPPANGNMMLVKPTATLEALAAAGVTEAWSRQPLPQFGEPFSSEAGVFRYRVAGPGRASTEAGSAQIERETLDSVTVKATGPGVLTLRDRNLKGWTAEIDGKSVPIKDGRWREVDLPAGSHTVVFRYNPPAGPLGNLSFSIGTVLLIVVLIASNRGQAKRRDDNPTPTSPE
jgi:hypothetical protein